jgi:hypothetical protein
MNHSSNGNKSLFSNIEYNITSPNISLESLEWARLFYIPVFNLCRVL